MAENIEEKGKWKLLPTIGFLAFLVALIVAIIGGIVAPDNSGLILTLIVVGILVGLLNITASETQPLLLAAIALIVIGVGTGIFKPLDNIINPVGTWIDHIVNYFTVFMTPAAIIAAIKILFQVARPG